MFPWRYAPILPTGDALRRAAQKGCSVTQPSTLVLFDIDGTLLSPEGCGRIALDLALHEVFGRSGDIDNHRFAGKTDWQSVAELLGIDDDTVRAHMPAFEAAAARHMEAVIHGCGVRPCPGARELVATLAETPAALVGLLTGNMRTTALIKLRVTGFDPDVFRVGAYGSEARARAALPPLAIARAEALAGVRFPGQRVVIVGDTEADVACGQGVSARTLAVASGFSDRALLEASNPDYLFDDLSDQEAVLAAIFEHGERGV